MFEPYYGGLGYDLPEFVEVVYQPPRNSMFGDYV